jgi:hypothetical protein
MRGVVCLGNVILISVWLFVGCFAAGTDDDPDGASAAGEGGSGDMRTGGSSGGGEPNEGGASTGRSGGPGTGGENTDSGGSMSAGGSAGSDGGNASANGGSADSNGGASSGAGGSNGGEGGDGFAPPGAILFSEDFEDGNYDGWTVPNFTHTATVVSDTGAEGTTHSLRLTAVGPPADYLGLYRTFTDLEPTYVSYWLFCDDPAGTKVALSGTSPNATPISIVLWGGSDAVYSSSGAVLAPSSTGWHHIEIRIDWDDATVDYLGDGVLREEDLPFYYGVSTSLGRMDFSHSSDASCYLDQIEFRE